MIHTSKQDIQQLNSLLRGELAAVETYQQCIDKMGDQQVVPQVQALQESHRQRVRLLADRVRRLGGEPAQSSGVWGSIASFAEGSAKLFGQSAAVSALEEGEGYGQRDYRRALVKLSPQERQFVETQILPEQVRTHATLSRIGVTHMTEP